MDPFVRLTIISRKIEISSRRFKEISVKHIQTPQRQLQNRYRTDATPLLRSINRYTSEPTYLITIITPFRPAVIVPTIGADVATPGIRAGQNEISETRISSQRRDSIGETVTRTVSDWDPVTQNDDDESYPRVRSLRRPRGDATR